MAPSRTRSARSTSIVKSTCPGVSMMLMCVSFHWQNVAAARARPGAAGVLWLHTQGGVAARWPSAPQCPRPRTRLDGDAFLALQVHAVHLGAHAVLAPHLVNGVDAARVEKDAFCQRGLADVIVGLRGGGGGTGAGAGSQKRRRRRRSLCNAPRCPSCAQRPAPRGRQR